MENLILRDPPSLDDIPLSNAPIIISKGNIYLNFGPWAKVPPKELLQFTKKVATMIKAGLAYFRVDNDDKRSNCSYENENDSSYNC